MAQCANCTDDDLNATVRNLVDVDFATLEAGLPAAIEEHGCTAAINCTVPTEIKAMLLQTPEPICPFLGKWDPDKGCPTEPVMTTTTEAAGTTIPGGSDSSGDGVPTWLIVGGAAVGGVVVLAGIVGICSKCKRNRADSDYSDVDEA